MKNLKLLIDNLPKSLLDKEFEGYYITEILSGILYKLTKSEADYLRELSEFINWANDTFEKFTISIEEIIFHSSLKIKSQEARTELTGILIDYFK